MMLTTVRLNPNSCMVPMVHNVPRPTTISGRAMERRVRKLKASTTRMTAALKIKNLGTSPRSASLVV